jgi:hypothetical protein
MWDSVFFKDLGLAFFSGIFSSQACFSAFCPGIFSSLPHIIGIFFMTASGTISEQRRCALLKYGWNFFRLLKQKKLQTHSTTFFLPSVFLPLPYQKCVAEGKTVNI